MIGIVLWAILIIFIVICACPGFITALIINSAIVLSVYGLIWWIKSGCKLRYKRKRINEQFLIEKNKQDREAAIDEWERKWNRKHPTRKIDY